MTNETPSSRGIGEDDRNATPASQDVAYTTGEAALALGVASSRVRKMIARGELSAHRDEEGHHRIPRNAIRAKLGEGGFASPSEVAGLREEVGAASQELRRLGEEVRALRDELQPLAHLARSAQEDKQSTLKANRLLQEERILLLKDLEEERRRNDELEGQYEAFRLKWWAPQEGKNRGGTKAP